jgi:MvaI/BcnI restriction endonuclease family
MKSFSKGEVKSELIKIREQGFVPNRREGNHGGIGNTLEDLLGIEENNLPIPNAAEWELKCQKIGTTSLTTLFHVEPSPTAMRLVPSQLLPLYGWKHEKAGVLYPENEVSFRQTINSLARSDRGFQVVVDEEQQKIMISFDANSVSEKHSKWLQSVKTRVGLGELHPQPYWGFNDLFHKAGAKLLNCFYVQAEVKKIKGQDFYHYKEIMMLKDFSLTKFLTGIKEGYVLVDFDARTGHNHGTKFRLRQNYFPKLYDYVEKI